YIMSRDTKILWYNVILALLLLPAYQMLGEALKYVVAPYVLYMVWKRDPIYLPALFVHFTPGSTISSFILILVLVLTIADFSRFRKMGIGWLLLLALLPLPFFIYQTIERIFVLNQGLIQILTPLSFYLGIFPFF